MQRRRRRSVSKLSLILLAIFLVLLAGAGVTAFKTLNFVSNVSTANMGDNIRSIVSTTGAGQIVTGSPAPAAQLPPRINILLLGYGGGGHDGADLTDSIMVLSFDQHTKKAAMISVPRDTWVRIPSDGANKGGFWKLNTAYAIGEDDQTFPNKQPEFKGAAGGGNLAAAVVGSMLGMKIDYWVAVDFHAFKSMVDALGGVDVNVEKTFTDYQYPRNDDPTVDASWMTVHFNAGAQHMTGEKAIEYARSRHSLEDGTDFGRSHRQQLLLLAIKSKALSKDGITKSFGMMDALSKDFKTNLTVGQIRAMADLAKGIDPAAIERISIDNTNYLADGETADGQSVLVPEARNWTALRAYISSVLMDPAVKTEEAKIQMWNGSGLPGVAGNATTMLNDLGLHTLPPQNLNSVAVQQTEVHDLSHGRDSSTVNYLASLFGARVVSEAPTAADQADIKVILGKSYDQPASIVDSYDPTVRLDGGPPPASDQPKPAVKPATAATVIAHGTAIAGAASARVSGATGLYGGSATTSNTNTTEGASGGRSGVAPHPSVKPIAGSTANRTTASTGSATSGRTGTSGSGLTGTAIRATATPVHR